MGVHGLSTYINKHQSLKQVVILPSPSASAHDSSRVPFIIDGLAFLYQIGLIDTFRGGNYYELRLLISTYIEYWRAASLEPEIVFDGPSEQSKSDTVMARSRQSLAKSLRYMKLRDDDRMKPGEMARAARLPLLSMGACVDAFTEAGVVMHFAQGEADSPTAELAQRKQGYMASVDSDYFIFPSDCRGYVPLNQIEYGKDRLSRPNPTMLNDIVELYLPVYHYRRTASALSIAPEYLPVFAALIGNDHFSTLTVMKPKKAIAHQPYPGFVNKEDTSRIARALGSVPSGLTTEGCIRAVLPNLAARGSINDTLVDPLLLSASTYKLQPLETSIATFPFSAQPDDSALRTACRKRFGSAYKRGRVNMFLCSILKHRTISASGILDDPEFQSTSIYIGRPLRLWVYAILDNAVGFQGDSSIKEYVRRNEDLKCEVIRIPHLDNMLESVGLSPPPVPLVLASPETRLTVYLAALHWFHAAPMSSTFLPLVLSLRHIQCTTKRPWSAQEMAAACLAAVLLRSPDLMPDTGSLAERAPKKTWIQRSAELVQALWYSNLLAEALLLTGGADDYHTAAVGGILPLPRSHTLFDGALLHLLFDVGDALAVARGSPPAVQLAFEEVWSLLSEDVMN